MPAREEPGELFDDRYRLDEIVGEGGMAEVWRAADTVLERTVAIKILRPQFASDPDFVARFRSEARAAAALNDPGVVALFDVGQAGNSYYLVMEYLPGSDLKQLLRDEAPLAPLRAVQIGAAIARAVGHAHRVGLVHRDIKPQNVLIAADGRMKVTDFGIARAIAAVGTTAPGIVLGTVHYLSPEQAAGGAASPASDVYSLGVVLYEMLTGSVPYEAESSIGVAMRIVNEDPVPVDQLNPKVPAVLAGIVAKAMARRPEDRYPDAAGLAEALEGFARWSDQATGALKPAAKSLGATAAGGRGGSGLSAVDAEVPLLDRTGLLLAAVAFLSVAGLVPLWTTVLDRVEPSLIQRALGFAPQPPPTSMPVPTSTTDPAQVGEADVVVPDVRGLSEEAARQQLAERELGVSVGATESFTATPGIVLVQHPPPSDTAVPAGTVVNIVISGQPLAVVPTLSGSYETAAAQLAGVGLEPRQRLQWGGANAATGTVLSVDPPPGSRLPRESPVYLTVSGGSWLPMGIDFDDHIHLSGLDLPRATLNAGESLGFAARWEATGAVTGDYLSVAELLGSAGPISRDAHVPHEGLGATNTWQEGAILFGDTFSLTVPPETPAGTYRLVIGMERNDGTGTPLAALGGRTEAGKVVAIEVTVQAAEQAGSTPAP